MTDKLLEECSNDIQEFSLCGMTLHLLTFKTLILEIIFKFLFSAI